MFHTRILLVVFALTSLTAFTVHAHHAAAAVFTDEELTIEGVVTEFRFVNPHINVMLDVTDADGVTTEWMVTGPAPAPMRRWGWTPETVQSGQLVRFVGKKSRTGAPMLLIESAEIQGGAFAELDSDDGSVVRVLKETPDDSQAPDPALFVPAELANDRPNLSGTWLGGLGRPRSVFQTPPPFNNTAAAVQAEFDAINDPAWIDCADHGLVRQAMTGHAVRVSQYDDRVVLEYEQGAALRVLYLDNRGADAAEHTLLGHPVARYDADALIVETTQLLGGLTGTRGNALSDRMRVVETYRRADNDEFGPLLEMTIVITDPETLTGPWEMRWLKNYAATDYEFADFDCRLPLTAGD